MPDMGDAMFDELAAASPDKAYVRMKCAKCYRTQPYTMGTSEVGERFAEVKFTCAFCGYRNESSGVHETVAGPNGRLRMAFHDMTSKQLSELQERLKEAAASAQTTEDLAAAVESSSPQVASWIRSQPNRNEVYAVLALLIAVISLWMTFSQRNQSPPSQSQLNQVITNVEVGNYRDMPVGRNDPCLCGSGKNYKKCHGRPPSAKQPDTWPRDTPWLGSRG